MSTIGTTTAGRNCCATTAATNGRIPAAATGICGWDIEMVGGCGTRACGATTIGGSRMTCGGPMVGATTTGGIRVTDDCCRAIDTCASKDPDVVVPIRAPSHAP